MGELIRERDNFSEPVSKSAQSIDISSLMLAEKLEPIVVKRLQDEKPIDDIEKTLRIYQDLEDSIEKKQRQAFLQKKTLRNQSFYFSFLASILAPLILVTLGIAHSSSKDHRVSLYLLGAGSGVLAVSTVTLLSEQIQERKSKQ